MALHNPALEAAAAIRHALSDKLITMDFCRHWCADNKEQALRAVQIAARHVDDLREWGYLDPPQPRANPAAADVAAIIQTLKFISGTARDLRAYRLAHLASAYDDAARLIEQLSGITLDPPAQSS